MCAFRIVLDTQYATLNQSSDGVSRYGMLGDRLLFNCWAIGRRRTTGLEGADCRRMDGPWGISGRAVDSIVS